MRRYPLGRHPAPYSIDPAPSHRTFTAFTVDFTGFSSCLYNSSINREIRSDSARPEVFCKRNVVRRVTSSYGTGDILMIFVGQVFRVLPD